MKIAPLDPVNEEFFWSEMLRSCHRMLNGLEWVTSCLSLLDERTILRLRIPNLAGITVAVQYNHLTTSSITRPPIGSELVTYWIRTAKLSTLCQGWNPITLKKEDVGKFDILKTIYESDGITRYGISKKTGFSKVKVHSDIEFWENTGAIQGTPMTDDRRRKITYHITDVGIMTLFAHGTISQSQINESFPQHRSLLESVTQHDEFHSYPTPGEITHVANLVCTLLETVFPERDDLRATDKDGEPLPVRLELMAKEYDSLYEKRQMSEMSIVLGGIHLYLQSVVQQLEDSIEFRNIYRKLCNVLDRNYNLSR